MSPLISLFVLLSASVSTKPQQTQIRHENNISLIAGRCSTYRTIKRQSLSAIAQQNHTDSDTLSRLNHLSLSSLPANKTLTLPSLFIPPQNPGTGIVLDIPERAVYVFRQGTLLARYPVAVGQPTWQTPIGDFAVERKVKNPTWVPPSIMVKRKGISPTAIPPGPKNPLGDRWMGWRGTQVGFHGTPQGNSIGKLASHGCVRMYIEDSRRLFEQVSVGTPIVSQYEPIRIGRDESGNYYLRAAPDIYHKGMLSPEAVEVKLAEAGLLDRVDMNFIAAIVAWQESYPYWIAADTETVESSPEDRGFEILPDNPDPDLGQ